MFMDVCNIFYSWQSDIKESKNFISDCLKQLPKKLKDMAVVEVDRDTEGIAGSPDIGDSIYMKIDRADIFVADVTIINKDWSGRKMPNPNVMIELGYAIKALGWERIVLLYNRECGSVESQPFDINHQRMTGYSLQEEKKAEARNRIISNIAATISILKDKNRLHGGNPDVMKARHDLTKTLWEGMNRIHRYYMEKWLEETDRPTADFVVVTDVHLALAETIKGCLTDSQYFQLTGLLQKLKLTSTGNEDRYGWEFAEEIAAEYFEPLYCEFGSFMRPLPMDKILCREFVTLYEAVSGKDDLQYNAVRKVDGRIVFADDGSSQEAYDVNGSMLCKGVLENGLFTGYRRTREYAGDWAESKRNGQGCENSDILNRDRFECGAVRREGIWKDDKLVKGRVYSAIVQKSDGEFTVIEYGEDWPLIVDQSAVSFFIGGLAEEELSCCYVADLDFEDGEYRVLEETVKDLAKADHYGCYEALIGD